MFAGWLYIVLEGLFDGTSTVRDVGYWENRGISLRVVACGDENVFLLMGYGTE